jgi:hypothetical protein
VLLHTASIARGNSGGPLLDRCGRVIGINSAITRGEEGDSSFGFAIADTELAAFLRAAKQPFQQVGTPCTSIEERLRQDSEAEARARADAATSARDSAAQAALTREEALAEARTTALTRRENVMAIAGLMLVLGAMGIGGGGLLVLRGDPRRARWSAVGGGALMAGAVAVFLLRPSAEVTLPTTAAAATPQVASANAPLGTLTCTFLPARSRITVSSAADVTLNWGRSGCVNGHTQYLPDGDQWQRVLVPESEQTVSVARFDPATRTYSNTRYLLGAGAMDTVRRMRGTNAPKACTTDPSRIEALVQADAAIRAALPPLPNEKLVYSCRRSG